MAIQPRYTPLKAPDDAQARRLRQLHPFIRQSGNSWREPWYIAERSLFDYMLVYIPEGIGVFTLEDEIYPIGGQELFWVPPDTRHSMRGTGRVMQCLYLHFDLSYDPGRSHWNAIVPGGLTDLSPWPERVHPAIDLPEINALRGILDFRGPLHELKELLENICREHLRCSGYTLKLNGMMLELLELIIANTAREGIPDGHGKVMTEAAAYLRDNACKITSLAAVAARFGFSLSHFRRLFTHYHGQAPFAVVNQYRMKQACELLAYGNCNVSETAERCGFKSIHSFSRAFKNHTGMPPGSYR